MSATSTGTAAEAAAGDALRNPARRAGGEIIAALALLTRLPVPASSGTAARTGAAAFGLVGALLGVGAAIPVLLVGGAAPLLGAVLAVVALAAASGALHLDGLADTADALAAPNPEAAEAARRDPRLGAAGAVAIGGAMLVDVSAIATLVEAAGPAIATATLVAAAAWSRAAPGVLALASPPGPGHAHGDTYREGFGRWFADRVSRASAILGLLTAAGASVPLLALGGLTPAAGVIAGGAVGVLLSLGVVRLRRKLDGDALGASVELTLAAVLVAVAVAASRGSAA